MPASETSPSRAQLAALEADAWGVLLLHVRAALAEVGDDPAHPRRQVVSGLPTGRLAGGKGREQVTELVVSDPELWRVAEARLGEDPQGVAVLSALQRTGRDDPATQAVGGSGSELSTTTPAPDADQRAQDQALLDARRRAQRDRDKLKEVRQQRDEARQRADAEERRSRRLTEELSSAQERLESLELEVASLQRGLQVADRERDRAVARERRRRDADLAELRDELTQLRRSDERRREADRRASDRQRSATERPAGERTGVAGPGRGDVAAARLAPGRPSQLPQGVVPGTREAVEAYLHRGRRVVIDGYNVTLQRHANLPLEQQRTWLVGAVANLARARGIRPTVVFDGERSGGRRAGASGREVIVRFTDAGITADDEIVLEVEATDDPIVVVTDDRELAARVRASGADVVASRELLWLL